MRRVLLALLLSLTLAGVAQAKPLRIGIVAFQMSSETHARTASAAAEAAKARGWTVTLLNSRGSIPESAAQIESLIAAKPDALVLCMTKPIELDAQLEAARRAGIPVVTVASGTSPHTLFAIQANEYQVGSDARLYLLGLLNYPGAILAERFEGNLATRIRGRMLDAVLAENPAVKAEASHSMARTASWQEDCAPACPPCCSATAGSSRACGRASTDRPSSSTTCCRRRASGRARFRW